jgi:hypothetical protein
MQLPNKNHPSTESGRAISVAVRHERYRSLFIMNGSDHLSAHPELFALS